MAELKIKEESLPLRCEVCHQRDCYDPINNTCSRCSTIIPVEKITLEVTHYYKDVLCDMDRLRTLWKMSLYFKAVVFIPLLYCLIVSLFGSFDEILPSYKFWKISPFWGFFPFYFSFFGPGYQSQLQAQNKEYKAIQNFKLWVSSYTAIHILWTIYSNYAWSNSDNPLQTYFTSMVWILNVILPLVYIILVLFIPDKTFPIPNKSKV